MNVVLPKENNVIQLMAIIWLLLYDFLDKPEINVLYTDDNSIFTLL